VNINGLWQEGKEERKEEIMEEDLDFSPILADTLRLEGGRRVDSDGLTNNGIRQPIYDSYTKLKKLPQKSVDELNWGETSSFYKDEFYDKVKDLPTKNLKGVAFDFAVNAGTPTAVKNIQSIVGSKADGIIGKKTIASINKFIAKNGEDALVRGILQSRVEHNYKVIEADPSKAEYERGWNNRIESQAKTYSSQE